MLFKSLHLPIWVNETLNSNKLIELTEIQSLILTNYQKAHNLIVLAKTGSGKTLCYLLPILDSIDLVKNKTQAIIIAPTKELSNQVYQVLMLFKKYQSNLKIKLLNNFDSKKATQLPHVIIGTPAKIYEYVLNHKNTFDLNYFIMDEVDMLIDFGFYQTIKSIFLQIDHPNLRKWAISATLQPNIANQLKKIIKDTKIISNIDSLYLHPSITHNLIYQSNNIDSLNTLNLLLKTINPYFCLIFANTKKECEAIYKLMIEQNYNACLIHKDLLPRQRKQIFKKIRANQFQYVVTTDLLARGIDLPDADLVISYGLSDDPSWYINRSGRIGRYIKKGNSYLIYRPNDDWKINNLVKKGIHWVYLKIDKNLQLVEKQFKLRFKKPHKLDYSTNLKIKKIIGLNSKKVKPGYKKKINTKIKKIKQKVRHQEIEKKIKKQLIQNRKK